ncbi:MAG TPA: beta-L-arabinofuranosidase domain-containing protein [Planctomycetota bacterium]|jgi:hypothetical protein
MSRFQRCACVIVTVSALAEASVFAAEIVPYKVPEKMPDVLQLLSPADVKLEGYLGTRVSNSEKNRLLVVNEEELLAGFRKRPGKQAWIGEHVGKFLHAATLAWVNTNDAELRAKIDRVASELIKTQDADGYMGTYAPEKKWTSWDVWCHKYDLLGLLTYYQFTGNAPALEASRKIGDLLINTFGPGKRSIIKAGEHVGMAATSVLEPVVQLYRFTAEEKYLDFAKYIIASWEEPGGPNVLKTLTDVKAVNKTANGKAYEMLSNLVGLCELARVTGDKQYLTPCLNAWEDIVAHQLYITGSCSRGEHFGPDYDLPNIAKANVGETCVTTTWIQLNLQLLRLTGLARYGDELERSYLNHLSSAQLPDGSKWCYYTSLVGTKPYGNSTNCCLSSGPRAMALAPQAAYLKYQTKEGVDGVIVNFFETSKVTMKLGGQNVTIEQKTDFPLKGSSVITLKMDAPVQFDLKVRAPKWSDPLGLRLHVSDPDFTVAADAGDWSVLPAHQWKNGDQITLTFSLATKLVPGEHGNAGKAALTWGPIVLAHDAKQNPGQPSAAQLALALEPVKAAELKPVAPASLPAGVDAATALAFEVPMRGAGDAQPKNAKLVPFAVAGADGGYFQVWLHWSVEKLPAPSLLMDGKEKRSRAGNMQGSINDGDVATIACTFNGKAAEQDWYSVELDQPATFKRVVFAHGKSFHDGGWFDASAGKPQIQVRREKGGEWEKVGELADYPATTAADAKGLQDGQIFTLKLNEAIKAVGVRITGKPASGDGPQQAFSSCAELQAFAE